MGATAVVIIRKQREIVEVFEGARATNPAQARVPNDLGIDQSLIFRRLVDRAVLREVEPGRYYLDQPSWAAFRRTRRRFAIIALVVALLAILIASLRVIS